VGAVAKLVRKYPSNYPFSGFLGRLYNVVVTAGYVSFEIGTYYTTRQKKQTDRKNNTNEQ
jgi:hypothetical protein